VLDLGLLVFEVWRFMERWDDALDNFGRGFDALAGGDFSLAIGDVAV
jgi:hypothetical protein